jgi:hypothetical protein
VAGDRDTVELYLEGMPLPPERLEGSCQEVCVSVCVRGAYRS